MSHLHLDFETRSRLSIKAVGLDRYARGAEVLMLGWALDDGPVSLWIPTPGDHDLISMPSRLHYALTSKTCTKVAWNHQFERSIFRHALNLDIPNEQWLDPGVLARYAGVAGIAGGGSLDFACGVFKLPIAEAKQAKAGKALIKLFSVPNKKGAFNDSLSHPAEWEQFCEYCRQDVRAERAVLGKVKHAFQLPEAEQRLWILDSKINETGMPVDMAFVQHAKLIVERERDILTNEQRALTGCENPNSRNQLLVWLKTQGYPYNSLGKKWVTKALGENKEASNDGSSK